MKKIFLVLSLLCFSVVAYAGIWNKTADKSSGLFGANSGNQTNISIGDADKNSGSGTDGTIANESEWNIDVEGMGMLMPNQTSRVMVTSPISIGATYKFSETLHIAYKYVKFEVDGGQKTQWSHESHLVGFGFRRFFNQNKMQFVATVGSGTTTLKEKSGQVSLGDYEAPIWADVSFLWVIDNFSFGPRFSFVEVDTKSDVAVPVRGGYSFVGLTVQFGIPEYQ